MICVDLLTTCFFADSMLADDLRLSSDDDDTHGVRGWHGECCGLFIIQTAADDEAYVFCLLQSTEPASWDGHRYSECGHIVVVSLECCLSVNMSSFV